MSVVTYAPVEALDLVLAKIPEEQLMAGARTVDGVTALDLALQRHVCLCVFARACVCVFVCAVCAFVSQRERLAVSWRWCCPSNSLPLIIPGARRLCCVLALLDRSASSVVFHALRCLVLAR